MVKNRWYAVLESSEVKKKPLGVTRLGERLVFWRDKTGKVFCLKDKCAHRGASLAKGILCDDKEAIACPFHGFEYDKTGACRLIPANGRTSEIPSNFKVSSYPTEEVHGMIFIWWGEKREEYPPVPRFNDLNEKEYSCMPFKDHWAVHYTRAIENQLDLVHVPFVHYDTIGRGKRTLVNGPVQVADGEEVKFWVYNEKDVGQTPKKDSELPTPDVNKQHIHFIFPNIWQNWVLEKMRVFVAFAPIDDENTMIYVRAYQKLVKFPIIREIMDFINKKFSMKVLSQDKAVVLTQIPISSTLKMNENLVKGDLPIIAYRRLHEASRTVCVREI